MSIGGIIFVKNILEKNGIVDLFANQGRWLL